RSDLFLRLLELALELLHLRGQAVHALVVVGVDPRDARGEHHPDNRDEHHQDNQYFSRGGHHTTPGPRSEVLITAQFNLLYLLLALTAKRWVRVRYRLHQV